MFVAGKDQKIIEKPNMREGNGTIILGQMFSEDKLPPHCRLMSEITINKGCSIGEHEHMGEAEVFYAVKGEGIVCDNGTDYVMQPGDSHICPSGSKHSLRNDKDEPFVVFAVITTEA